MIKITKVPNREGSGHRLIVEAVRKDKFESTKTGLSEKSLSYLCDIIEDEDADIEIIIVKGAGVGPTCI